jgi:membrane-associated phospholipid phosphatase
VQAWSPLVIAVLVVRGSFAPLAPWQQALFVACVSLIVADQFRESIGDVCGRYWPETWHHNNPSLIDTGTYGFHAFEPGDEAWKPGDDTGSFPSGHATRIAAFAAVFWIAFPRPSIRALLLVASLPMLASLVLMNYHFVGDVVGGLFVGTLVAAWASYFARRKDEGMKDEKRKVRQAV